MRSGEYASDSPARRKRAVRRGADDGNPRGGNPTSTPKAAYREEAEKDHAPKAQLTQEGGRPKRPWPGYPETARSSGEGQASAS